MNQCSLIENNAPQYSSRYLLSLSTGQMKEWLIPAPRNLWYSITAHNKAIGFNGTWNTLITFNYINPYDIDFKRPSEISSTEICFLFHSHFNNQKTWWWIIQECIAWHKSKWEPMLYMILNINFIRILLCWPTSAKLQTVSSWKYMQNNNGYTFNYL